MCCGIDQLAFPIPQPPLYTVPDVLPLTFSIDADRHCNLPLLPITVLCCGRYWRGDGVWWRWWRDVMMADHGGVVWRDDGCVVTKLAAIDDTMIVLMMMMLTWWRQAVTLCQRGHYW